MTTEETLTTINIILTAMTLTVGYFTYQFSKKKDFQDKLFNIKADAYNDINEQCYAAIRQLDVNAMPFVKIYNFDNSEEWNGGYYEMHVLPLLKVGLDIEKTIFKYTIFLPTGFCDKLDEFSKHCIRFVAEYAHFDTGLNCESQDKLWDLYIGLVDAIREDLKVETLDKELRKRIKPKIL